MFFIASKTLDILIDPLWWVVGCIVVAAYCARSPTAQRLVFRWLAVALTVLLVASAPLVANVLKWSLERGVQAHFDETKTWDVVVLLGGTVDFPGSTVQEVAWNGNVERLIQVYALLRTNRVGRAILSGGVGVQGFPTEAEYLHHQLIEWGIEPNRLELEAKAQNTRENAVFAQSLIAARGDKTVLVVTSASHVPRALGCFRAIGLEVDIWPVDYRMKDPWAHQGWAPRAEYLGETSRALREYLGRLTYWALGYSKF